MYMNVIACIECYAMVYEPTFTDSTHNGKYIPSQWYQFTTMSHRLLFIEKMFSIFKWKIIQIHPFIDLKKNDFSWPDEYCTESANIKEKVGLTSRSE